MLKYAAGIGVTAFGAILGIGLLARTRSGQNERTLSTVAEPGDYDFSFQYDGRDRNYRLHVPLGYDSRAETPVVIVLHGGGGNARNVAEMTGMSEKSDEEGFLVAYPNGTGRLDDALLTWNAGTCCEYALEHNIDDVGFIRALLARLEQQVRIDSSRIFVTGISNGGMMTYRLACELADSLAAIAPVAAALNNEDCRPSHPVSVVIFHGTADEHVPYYGGIGSKARDERVDKPVSHAVSFWVNHNRCSPIPVMEEFGNIRKETYNGGIDGTEVVLYTILGGGHAWPGGEKGYPWGDEPPKEISATDLMWEFFASHPKRMQS